MSAIMKSISPKECERIANGEQTVLVSKTRPKIETPFKCYICRTTEKVEEIVEEYDSNFKLLRRKKTIKKFKGKVIGEFVCDRIYEIRNLGSSFMIGNDIALTNRIARESCLWYPDLRTYLKDKKGYAWHISDIKIYDKPKELEEFYTIDESGSDCCCGCVYHETPLAEMPCKACTADRRYLYRPPQSWCYVEEL